MKLVRIDYTIYSPKYVTDQGECWDFPTFLTAKAKARKLGVGSIIVRNFNKTAKAGKAEDWWQSSICWVWNGINFKKTFSVFEKKWVVAENPWFESPLLTRACFRK